MPSTSCDTASPGTREGVRRWIRLMATCARRRRSRGTASGRLGDRGQVRAGRPAKDVVEDHETRALEEEAQEFGGNRRPAGRVSLGTERVAHLSDHDAAFFELGPAAR